MAGYGWNAICEHASLQIQIEQETREDPDRFEEGYVEYMRDENRAACAAETRIINTLIPIDCPVIRRMETNCPLRW